MVVVAIVGVVREQDWPLLGTNRSAALAMFVVGFVMCQIGRGSISSARELVRGPFMMTASILGVGALTLAVVGVIADSRALVLALGAVLLATWALATIHHAVERPVPHVA
jgi:hypothetical protein